MDKKPTAEALEATPAIQPVVVPYPAAPEEKVICDVCGHANPKYTAQCRHCSNYL